MLNNYDETRKGFSDLSPHSSLISWGTSPLAAWTSGLFIKIRKAKCIFWWLLPGVRRVRVNREIPMNFQGFKFSLMLPVMATLPVDAVLSHLKDLLFILLCPPLAYPTAVGCLMPRGLAWTPPGWVDQSCSLSANHTDVDIKALKIVSSQVPCLLRSFFHLSSS